MSNRSRRPKAVINVPEGPKSPDRWIEFKPDHPLQKMLLSERNPLGSDKAIADRRYQAGILWHRDYLSAIGSTTGGTALGEKVDTTPSRDGFHVRRLAAGQRRRNVLERVSISARRIQILDHVCGHGYSITEAARVIGIDHSTAREHFIAGLDLLCAGYRINDLETVPVPRIRKPYKPSKKR